MFAIMYQVFATGQRTSFFSCGQTNVHFNVMHLNHGHQFRTRSYADIRNCSVPAACKSSVDFLEGYKLFNISASKN